MASMEATMIFGGMYIGVGYFMYRFIQEWGAIFRLVKSGWVGIFQKLGWYYEYYLAERGGRSVIV